MAKRSHTSSAAGEEDMSGSTPDRPFDYVLHSDETLLKMGFSPEQVQEWGRKDSQAVEGSEDANPRPGNIDVKAHDDALAEAYGEDKE